MHLLRRAAVRTALFQSPRHLSASRTITPRIAVSRNAQPICFRPFHQARIWRAEEDGRPIGLEEASPSDATTTGETVPVETLEERASTEPFEREEVAEQFKDEAVEAAEAAELAADVAEDAAAVREEGLEDAYAATAASRVAEGAAEVAEAASYTTPGIAQFPSGRTAPTEDVAAAAAQTAQAAAQTATTAATAAVGAPGPQQPSQQSRGRLGDRDSGVSAGSPSRILYIGNLFFEVTALQLEAEFSKFGQITNSRIVTDNQGLSKGFGYLEFANQESADRAVREADQRVFQGRRMAVQYHIRRETRRFGSGVGTPRDPHPPSKTLFIGNMSYQMSDRDLNDLFREIRDVLDVRVAIDRRTGQPRGFAHADFVDVAAATRAKEVLERKVAYGRQLRVDFSASSNATRQVPGEENMR